MDAWPSFLWDKERRVLGMYYLAHLLALNWFSIFKGNVVAWTALVPPGDKRVSRDHSLRHRVLDWRISWGRVVNRFFESTTFLFRRWCATVSSPTYSFLQTVGCEFVVPTPIKQR